MSTKLTTSQWIEKAKKVHGNKYNYSHAIYQGSKQAITVICPDHGPWQCNPSNHITQRRGCPMCGGSLRKEMRKFIEQSRSIHGNQYDYSRALLGTPYSDITIICLDHGEFHLTPSAHLKGTKCPLCNMVIKD